MGGCASFRLEPCKNRLIQKGDLYDYRIFGAKGLGSGKTFTVCGQGGGRGIAGSNDTLTEESFSFPFGKKGKETGLERTRSEYETGRRSRLRHFRRHWQKQRTIQRTDDHPILCADAQLGRRPRRWIPAKVAAKAAHRAPGNALGCHMNGTEIDMHNAQDTVGDAMNNGVICVYGSAGNACSYAMHGGEMYLRCENLSQPLVQVKTHRALKEELSGICAQSLFYMHALNTNNPYKSLYTSN